MFSRKFFVLLLQFLLLWTSLIVYLFLYNSNSLVFWFIIVSIALLLTFQINYAINSIELTAIYAEIAILFVALQLISIANAGMDNLYWLDSSYELRAAKNILTNCWIPSNLGTVSPYPAVHFLIICLSQVTGIELVNLARWMGLLMHGMALLFYIMFGKYITKDNKVILLSGLSFIYLYYYVMVTGFGRMPLSMALYFLILYLIIRNSDAPTEKFTFITILSSIALLFAHPLAPIVLAAFLIFNLIIYCLTRYNICSSKLSRNLGRGQLENTKFASINFVLLLLTGIAAYFVYISIWSHGLLISTFSILNHKETAHSIGTGLGTPLNWRIFLYGQGIIGLIFGFLIFESKKARKHFFILLLVVFSVFLVFWSFLSYYLKIEFMRFTLFIWPFMLLSTSYAIRNFKHRNILSYLMVVFIIINISGYYPDVYNHMNEPRYSMGEWRQYLTVPEKISVSNFDTYGKIIGNHYINMAFLSLKNRTIDVDSSFYTEGFRKPSAYSFFYFEQIDKQRIFVRDVGTNYSSISPKLYSDYQKTYSLSKVYVNGNVDVYKVSTLGIATK